MSIRQSRSSALYSDNREWTEQFCEVKWSCNVVICREIVRRQTGDNSNTQLVYRDVIMGVLRSFIAS